MIFFSLKIQLNTSVQTLCPTPLSKTLFQKPMTLYIGPEETFSEWTKQKADLQALVKAQKHGDHHLHPFPYAYLDREGQFDGHTPKDHGFFSDFLHGDRYTDRSPEEVARLLVEFVEKYNLHIDGLDEDWDVIFPLLDQIIEKYWGKLGAMFIERKTKSITFTCNGSDLATDIGKTVVALFGSFATTSSKFADGKMHVQGPIFYSGGRIFWHSFMRTMGFSTIKGPKYQLFDEIRKYAAESDFAKVSRRVELLDRFWDRSTDYGLYNGQAKLNIL